MICFCDLADVGKKHELEPQTREQDHKKIRNGFKSMSEKQHIDISIFRIIKPENVPHLKCL